MLAGRQRQGVVRRQRVDRADHQALVQVAAVGPGVARARQRLFVQADVAAGHVLGRSGHALLFGQRQVEESPRDGAGAGDQVGVHAMPADDQKANVAAGEVHRVGHRLFAGSATGVERGDVDDWNVEQFHGGGILGWPGGLWRVQASASPPSISTVEPVANGLVAT
jgi:hypothetical protein